MAKKTSKEAQPGPTSQEHDDFADDLIKSLNKSHGTRVAYNLAVTIFGGFASFIITWLIASTGSTMAPAFYVMIAAAISFVGTRFVREPAYLQRH